MIQVTNVEVLSTIRRLRLSRRQANESPASYSMKNRKIFQRTFWVEFATHFMNPICQHINWGINAYGLLPCVTWKDGRWMNHLPSTQLPAGNETIMPFYGIKSMITHTDVI